MILVRLTVMVIPSGMGARWRGGAVYFVDYGEDTGPIIGQKSFEIEPGDTLMDVKRKGLELE